MCTEAPCSEPEVNGSGQGIFCATNTTRSTCGSGKLIALSGK